MSDKERNDAILTCLPTRRGYNDHKETEKYVVFRIGIVTITAAAFLLTPIIITAHGGKTHAGTKFSRLQALQNATQGNDSQ